MLRDSLGDIVPESATVIRATELQQFLNCPRQWYILSHNGLNLTPVKSSPKMRLGTVWHKALEYYYTPEVDDNDRPQMGRDGLEAGFNEDLDNLRMELGDGVYNPEFMEVMNRDRELLQSLLEGYPQWANYEAQPSDRTLTPLATEQRFLLPVTTPSGYKSRAFIAAKVDALMEDNIGNFWIMEHKTRGVSSRVDDPQGLILDLQIGLQILAVKKWLRHVVDNAPPFRGVIYNLTRRQKPSSRVRSPIYGRHAVVRGATDLAILQHHLYQAYLEMRQVKRDGLKSARYNPQVWAGGYCTWGCPALNICEALTRGDDVDYLLDAEFRKRDKDIWQMLKDELDQ